MGPLPLAEQEAIIGDPKKSGAPLVKAGEFDDFDFATVPAGAHTRLAPPDFNNGARMLRRGYNVVEDYNGLSRLDAGLFFMAFQRDPHTASVPV